jgi:hypothetical protein
MRPVTMNKALPQRFGVVIALLTMPLLLAWLAVQMLPVLGSGQHSMMPSSGPSMLWLLLWGPLLETALLLLASAVIANALAKRKPGGAGNTATCTGIVGFSFAATHLLQNGSMALVSLPAALMLSAGTVHAVQHFCIPVMVRHGLALSALHALYNASLLGFSGALV